MLRVALRPRFLGLLALMIAATLVCGLLASWQWDRAHRALVEHRAAPTRVVPMSDLLALGEPVTNDAAGRLVRVSGTFDAAQQVLVPDRSIDGVDAVIVVTALEVPQEDGTTALLAVARGWIPAEQVRGPGGGLDASRIPAPPAGTVELTGHLEASEAATRGVTGGTVNELSTQLLVNEWSAPMYSAYLAETSPVTGLRAMPLASSDFSRGLDWQNVGYAAQWIVFGLFFLYLWWRSVRATAADEAADRAEAARRARAVGPEDEEGAEGAEDHAASARGGEDHGGASARPGAPGREPAAAGEDDASADAKEDSTGADTTTPR